MPKKACGCGKKRKVLAAVFNRVTINSDNYMKSKINNLNKFVVFVLILLIGLVVSISASSSMFTSINNSSIEAVDSNIAFPKEVKGIQNFDSLKSNDSTHLYQFIDSFSFKVVSNKFYVYSRNGKKLIQNNFLIRNGLEKIDCPYEGFREINVNGIYFTIEQQNCSGWNFIDEFITFKYSAIDKKFVLHNFSLIYTDRRNPENETIEISLNEKKFGTIFLENVKIDSLYNFLH